MAFDYSSVGWPAALVLDGANYTVTSCDKGDTGLVYKLVNGNKNPHVTIHGADKKGPHDWRRAGSFHVRVSNAHLYEYDRDGLSFDFAPAKKGGKGGTGLGTADQGAQAGRIAKDFSTAIRVVVTG
jgi:hypothetical protein